MAWLHGGSVICCLGSLGGSRNLATEFAYQWQNGSGSVTLNFGYNSSYFNMKILIFTFKFFLKVYYTNYSHAVQRVRW